MNEPPGTSNSMMEGGLTLGAYALFAGLPDAELARAYSALEALQPVSAIEMPLTEALGDRFALGATKGGLPAVISDRWDVVITCIPTVIGRLAGNSRYGLASIDDEGRAVAVADVRGALAAAVESAQASGRRRVSAIQVHSAPRGAIASAVALERSITELLGMEAAGADLVIEHCDAPRPGRVPEKGFLELTDELAVLESLNHERAGCTINWGRSAIEGRSAQTALDHVSTAASSGHLVGLMFSGATPASGPWGAPWADSHIAPRGAGEESCTWRESLLSAEEIAATTAAAGAVRYLGLKITTGRLGVPLAERIGIARRALGMIQEASMGACTTIP